MPDGGQRIARLTFPVPSVTDALPFFLDTPGCVAKMSISALQDSNADMLIFTSLGTQTTMGVVMADWLVAWLQ